MLEVTYLKTSFIADYVVLGARNVHFFFFNDTATTEIYTLSLHDALPIFQQPLLLGLQPGDLHAVPLGLDLLLLGDLRSEEHTSELQSQSNLVCRLLLEKKIVTQLKAKTRDCKIDNVSIGLPSVDSSGHYV